MSEVCIKDLQSAKSVIEHGFYQYEFVVDSWYDNKDLLSWQKDLGKK